MKLTSRRAILGLLAAQGGPAQPLPAKVQDVYTPAPFEGQQIEGLLGRRMQVNLQKRLLAGVDTNALLAGYRKRPGQQTWIGEHTAKFIDASTNTWAYSGDLKLREKLDRAVRGLIATQLADGYLGTYVEADRWKNWDLWAHKYNIIALLNYYGRAGYKPALAACRRAGDLLLKVYGIRAGQRNIVLDDWHAGMANTSVLEAMVALYRHSGDPKYLEFCRYIVQSWDHERGPRIIRTLLETGSVRKVANNKAYEMLSNFVGLVDLHRMTGDAFFLKPVLIAWQDVCDKRLYLSGSASWDEHFKEDKVLRADDIDEDAGVGEGCVTTTWVQLNLSLLRLTGEVRYAEELERTVYNSLLGAQHPEQGTICYFVPLNGKKRYGSVSQGIPGVSCCTSSIPRAIALIPAMAWGRRDKGIAINLYVPGSAKINLDSAGTANVRLQTKTAFPNDGAFDLTVYPNQPAQFPIYLRVPAWCNKFVANVNGKAWDGTSGSYLKIDQTWKSGDSIQVRMEMTAQVHPGGPSYPEHVALQRGPQVMALDSSLNSEVEGWVAGLAGSTPTLTEAASSLTKLWRGSQAYTVDGYVGNRKLGRAGTNLVLVPLSDAGQTSGSEYRVWLQKP